MIEEWRAVWETQLLGSLAMVVVFPKLARAFVLVKRVAELWRPLLEMVVFETACLVMAFWEVAAEACYL